MMRTCQTSSGVKICSTFRRGSTPSPVNEMSTRSEQGEKSKTIKEESSSFSHYDEDALRLVADLNKDKLLKYDVELLESRDVKKETEELEERFRGSAIKMDTDNFVDENIEVHGGMAASANADGVDDEDDDDDFKPNHLILTMVLVFVALFSISLYVALVIWRSHLERRYGMRELLVTDDDDFYLPSSEITADRQ
ncbi:uncharacterized protein [Eurosta solidaginis]|uniref:uncharacterized protein isoform X2 n=1 Tax=Eurosta solidaginis TaxID=178769 RepID=UPI003530D1C3